MGSIDLLTGNCNKEIRATLLHKKYAISRPKILICIFNKLINVSPIAIPTKWVIIFYILSKHFSFYVSILPGKNVSTSGPEGGYSEPDHESPLTSRQRSEVSSTRHWAVSTKHLISFHIFHCALRV
jgi:hypothetical protein